MDAAPYGDAAVFPAVDKTLHRGEGHPGGVTTTPSSSPALIREALFDARRWRGI
jgi:hypothetical protein